MTELATEAAKSGEFSDELIQMFYLLAEKTLDTYRGWNRYNARMVGPEDAIQEGAIACFEATPKFNAEAGDCYAFFRTTIKNCYYHLLSDKATPESRKPDRPMLRIDDVVDGEHDPETCLRRHSLYLDSERKGRRRGLDRVQVAEIRSRLAKGEKGTVLAQEFGVDRGTISKIKRGVTWRDK